MKEINIFHEFEKTDINKNAVKKTLHLLFEQNGIDAFLIDIILVSDEFLLKMNKEYLNHDEYTDIITFDLSKEDDVLEGELYISIERVRENSIDLSLNFLDELYRVIIHGCLHLCGFGDKTKEEIKTIRERENYYLKTIIE
jgi:probable rRNA maturation factor